jgi:hypothetical protein
MDFATQRWEQPRESGLFHYLIEKQTYLNLVYLLLAFPLGIAYFVFLVTGFSLGFGLIVTFLGIPILLGMLAATWGIAAFERQLANHLLAARIAPMPLMPGQGERLWSRIRMLVSNVGTWKALTYLFLAFPLGIFSFVTTVTLLSIPPYLVFLPIYYRWTNFYYAPYHRVDTLAAAFLFVPLGVVLAPISLAALNGLAAGYRAIARALLGSETGDAGPSCISSTRGVRTLTTWGSVLAGVGLALTLGLWRIGSIGAVARTFDAPLSIGPWLGGGFILFFTGAALLIAAALQWSGRRAWGLGVAGFGIGLSLTLWPIGYIAGVERTFTAPLHLGPWMAAGFIPLGIGLALIIADLPIWRA